jgi:transmembrane sensor
MGTSVLRDKGHRGVRCPYIVSNNLDYAKLGRFLAGECSDAEASEVREWLEDPANQRAFERLSQIWRRTAPIPPHWDEDAAWTKLATHLDRSASKVLALRDGRQIASLAVKRWLLRRPVMLSASAAALAVLAISGYAWITRARHQPTVPLREVATRHGQRAALDLPDGSRVVLAPGSRVRFAPDLGTSQGAPRDILLEGEAYFTVRHDSARPFRVQTITAVVEDLGTAFVVVTHVERREVDVAVVSGLVALRRQPATGTPPLLMLRRGDVARLDSVGTATLTPNANLAPYTAWTEGGLAFDATPLRDVAATLGKWYDLDVVVADSALAGRRLTASFRQAQAVSQVLDVIARSLDAHVERKGRVVVFRVTSR